jgi:predicted NUDIX family NTP pyrophosphohydrolase
MTTSTAQALAHVKANLHKRSRQVDYYTVPRQPVPDDKVDWSVAWLEYAPPVFTHPVVQKGPVWADPELLEKPDVAKEQKWEQLDLAHNVDRSSFLGSYSLNEQSLPLNPAGRTGLGGRGLLGRFGPNHAADPIVTRWATDAAGEVKVKDGKKVLEFVAITRKDTSEAAIPGGMVDPGEEVTATLQREFAEEALNGPEDIHLSMEARAAKLKQVFFNNGKEVYRGYADDPRNTDNAWLETVAVNFHDNSGTMQKVKLQGGDDASAAYWQEVSGDMTMYAGHKEYVHQAAIFQGAHW